MKKFNRLEDIRCPECGSNKLNDHGYDFITCRTCGNGFKLTPITEG